MKYTNIALAAIAMACLAPATRASVVAQYSFENNLSDTAAGGGTSDNLTYVKATSASNSAQYAAGVVGNAAVFDNNYFTAANSADLALNDNTWTIELFVKVSTHNATWDRLVLKWGGGHDYHLTLHSKNLDMYGDFPAHPIIDQNTAPVTDFTDGWHHIAVTSSAAGSQAWIDGVSVFTGAAITLPGGTDNFAIGDSADDPNADNRFHGWMDEVLLHDTAVDQTYINGRVALLSAGDVPAPAALPAGLAMITILAARRRRH